MTDKWTACDQRQCKAYNEGYEFNCKISGFTYYVSWCQARNNAINATGQTVADLMEDK